MTEAPPNWRAIRDRVLQIASNAERLAAELPDELVEAFRENMAEIASNAEAAELLIRGIEPGDDPAFNEEASLAEVWQLAGAAALTQVEDRAPMMIAALESLATHPAPAVLH